MSMTEWGILIGIFAQSIAVFAALLKLTAWFSAENATNKQRIITLEHQVDNDVTGRKVVGEMRADIATIKAQIIDMRDDFKTFHPKN